MYIRPEKHFMAICYHVCRRLTFSLKFTTNFLWANKIYSKDYKMEMTSEGKLSTNETHDTQTEKNSKLIKIVTSKIPYGFPFFCQIQSSCPKILKDLMRKRIF